MGPFIEQVRRELMEATGGPWYVDQAGDIRGHSTIESRRMVCRPLMSSDAQGANRTLITKSPIYLAAMLDVVQAAQELRDRLEPYMEQERGGDDAQPYLDLSSEGAIDSAEAWIDLNTVLERLNDHVLPEARRVE